MSLVETGLKKIFVQAISYCQSCSLIVRSVGVTTSQAYNNLNKEFIPDYTDEASVLQIFPECVLLNPDSPIASVVVNKELTDVSWEEVTPSGVNKIYPLATTTGVKAGYSVTTSGESNGEIFVKSNGVVGVKRTLRFKAKWYDSMSGFCYNFQKDIGLTIEDASEPLPELTVDVPKTYQWNPFRNPTSYVASASVYVGKKNVINDARCKMFWYRINDDKSKTLISSEQDTTTLEVTSVAKNSNGQVTGMTFNMEMISDTSSYEVVACFRSKGSLPSSPSASDPRYQFTLSRSIPKMTAEILSGNAVIADDIPSVEMRAIVKDNMDEIPNWQTHAQAFWYQVRTWVDSNNVTQESKTLLGTGDRIIVPTTLAGSVRLVIEDRGSYKPLVDENGKYLVTDSGEYLIERDIVI